MAQNTSIHTRLMSGMRPTGRLHIGNYMGALRNWLKLQNDYECFFSIVDWHALTDSYKEPKEVSVLVREFFAEWVAWGLNPEKKTSSLCKVRFLKS